MSLRSAARATLGLGILLGLGACANLSFVHKPAAPAVATRPPVAATPDVAPPNAGKFPLPRHGKSVIGQIKTVIAGPDTTLSGLARRYDVGYKEITEANPGVNPWVPGAGRRIVIPSQFILPDAPHVGIVINVAQMRLFYFPIPKPGERPMVITHPVGIGRRNWETPIGVTRVVAKIVNPVWNVPPSIRAEHAKEGFPLPKVVPAGPDNPLGAFALRLAIPGYLIHGTDKPYGVGMRVSHGCVHLYPEDIARLFPQVPIGTPVRIVNQPFVTGWLNGKLYLAANRPLAENRATWPAEHRALVQVVRRAALRHHPLPAIDWAKAVQTAKQDMDIPIPISRGTPSLDQVIAAAPVLTVPGEMPSEDPPGTKARTSSQAAPR
ncbi:MAG: L,D-transpeptidase family protein [Betaproteobacteria bacterium]|nr:L,D-transpeptidase family protein [Betaproteobacteria bacterium]